MQIESFNPITYCPNINTPIESKKASSLNGINTLRNIPPMLDVCSLGISYVLQSYVTDHKKVNLIFDETSGLEARVFSDSGKSIAVSKEWISGIPGGISNDRQKLEQFLLNTYIKLNSLNDGGYHVYVNHRVRGGGHIVTGTARLWRNGIVPIIIDEIDFPSGKNERIQVLKALKYWNDHTKFKFASYEKGDRDYLVITEHNDSCSSHVGKMGGAQFIRCDIDTGKFSTGSLMHELGHAVGLYHEHTRGDWKDYVLIDLNNVSERNRHNFKTPRNSKTHGPYDFDSIMHYPKNAFSVDGLDTITPISSWGNVRIGQRDHLSQGDIAAANDLVASSFI